MNQTQKTSFFKNSKENFIAQGTIEYLVIIAVVIVISLIVVGLVISSTDTTSVSNSGQKLGQQLQEISIMDVLLKPDGNYAVDLQSNLIENVTITRIAFDEDYEDFIGDNFLALGSRKLFIVNIEGLRRPDRCVENSLVTKNITITYTSSEGLSKVQRLNGLKIPCQVFETNTGAIALSDCPSGQYKQGNECIACTNAVEGLFASGSGTESDPYLICSWEQLNNVRERLDKSFKLINNLDSTDTNYADFAGSTANSNDGWSPIGDDSTPFIGEFDGQEYTISNLTIGENYSGSYSSLFGYISNASLSNVNLRDEINEAVSTYCGGIVGYSNNSIITSSSFSGTLNCYSDYIGGLIGYMDDGEINSSYNMSDISEDNLQYIGGLVAYVNSNTEINNSYNNGAITGSYYVGGLVAYVNLSAEINNSYNNGDITSNTTSYSGGIIGFANSSITISNSYNFSTASIRSEGAAGGLVGYIGTSGLIENSYNEGSVYGYYVAGGLVGTGTGTIRKSKNSGSISNNQGNYSDGFITGGIAGVFSGTIQDSYNTGYVDSDYYAGGIIGKNSESISLDGTYNNGQITGGENSFTYCSSNWYNDCYNYWEGPESCDNVPGCGWNYEFECRESSYCYSFEGNEEGCNSDPNCYWNGHYSCYFNGACYDNYEENACTNYDPYCTWAQANRCSTNCESIDNYLECSNIYYFNGFCGFDGISVGAGGGIAGNLSSGDVNTSFNTGSISGGLYPGGIVGELNGGSISNSWWDISTSGQAEGYFGGSSGCTSTNDNTSYYYNSSNPPLSYWDWSTVWLTDGDGYPQFLWEGAVRPNVSLTSPNGTTYLPYQTITFNYSVSTNFYSVDNCKLYIDDFLIETDNSISIGTNSFTYNFDYLTNPAEEREYIWNVICTDTNQNSSVNAEKTFNVDFITPTISLIAPTDTNYISGQIDFNYRPLFSYPIEYCELIVNDVILERDESIDNNVSTSFSATISDVNSYSWTVFCSSVNSDEGSGDELSFGVVNSCESSQIRLSNMCLNVCQNYVNGLYFFGDGTSQNPYLICSWEQLNNVRYNLSKYFKLIFDLSDANVGYATYASTTANDGKGWEAIGTSAAKFTGNFDGNYNTINDLYINKPATTEQGLFGNISSATISKIYLVDLNIIGKTAVGGIAGKMNSSTISDCYASGRIRGEGSVGGIIGQAYTGGSISRCINKSTVTGTNATTYIGGIVGQNSYAPITNSYNSGNITGVDRVGGIAGYLDAGTYENLYNTGVITGTSRVGGIIGYTYGYSLILRNVFNVGAVSGSTYKGGVVGLKYGTLSNSYWDTTLTGATQCYLGGNTGCTSTANTLSRYYNSALAPLTSWNFTTIWLARDNNFPILRWEQN